MIADIAPSISALIGAKHWRAKHEQHVKMLEGSVTHCAVPTSDHLNRPALWTPENWRWLREFVPPAPIDQLGIDAVLPCPFCGMSLVNVSVPDEEDEDGGGWAQHPENPACVLNEWEFDDFDPVVWNRRASCE